MTLDRLLKGTQIEIEEELPRPFPVGLQPTATYHGTATTAMTRIIVNGRIHHAERKKLRQPLIASRNNPIAASGSSIPTGPLPKTATPMQAYVAMA